MIEAMTKRNWTIYVPGYDPFPMILLDGELDYVRALAEARAIWPECTIS